MLLEGNEKKMVEKKNVCIIGLGFVGLTLGLVLSESGFSVVGVDKNSKVVEGIKNERPHFFEKGLSELLSAQLNKRFTSFTSIPKDQNFDIYVVSVGTPIHNDNKPNFSQLENVSNELGGVLKKGDLVILRSTVPVGVTRDFVIPLLERNSGMSVDNNDFFVAFAPERTVEGDAIHELKVLPQVVGGYNKNSTTLASEMFEVFAPEVVLVDSLEEAEMVKVINNSYRDLIFAFANELVLICGMFNIDTNKIVDAANRGYARSSVPKPSPGVGGYCLTKDPYLLVYSSLKKGDYSPLLPTISRKINTGMPNYMYKRIINFLDNKCADVEEKHVTLLGLAFKGNPPTSDVRFSPTIDLVKLLKGRGGIQLFGHDYLVSKNIFDENSIIFQPSLDLAFKDKSCVVMMNNHPDYANMQITSLVQSMRRPALVFDPWGLFDKDVFNDMDRVYYSSLGYHNY